MHLGRETPTYVPKGTQELYAVDDNGIVWHTKRGKDACWEEVTDGAHLNSKGKAKRMTPSGRPLRIYVAGPITADSKAQEQRNVDAAMDAGIQLLQIGHIPYIPHLTWYLHMYAKDHGVEFSHADYLNWDKRWLVLCDAILYLAPSPGADEELEFARYHGLRVFSGIEDVPIVVRVDGPNYEWDNALRYSSVANMQVLAGKIAREHGWDDNPMEVGSAIALMHSELSEALEEYRAGHAVGAIRYEGPDAKPEGVSVELADVVIRILHFYDRAGIPLQQVLLQKMKYNDTRAYRHGEKLI